MAIDNRGIVILNGNAASLPQKTVVVLGSQRSGTSMTTGVLSMLGVYIDEKEKLTPLFENLTLFALKEARDKRAFRALVRKIDAHHNVWCTKIHSPADWSWLGIFRQPVYVVPFRDPLAIANRLKASLGYSLLPEMFKVMMHYLLLTIFLRLTRRPALLFSYEKALLSPKDFVSSLQDFLGLQDHDLAREAARFIQPSPKEYTFAVNNTECLDEAGEWFGYVDSVENDRVSGWALNAKNPDPVEICLKANGNPVRSMIADLPRPDVAKANKRYRKNCGFEFKLEEGDLLSKGDEIDIKIVNAKELDFARMPRVIS